MAAHIPISANSTITASAGDQARFVSILIPFDSGRAYAIRFADSSRRRHAYWNNLLGGAWNGLTYQGTWSGTQFDEGYGKPLGWRVMLHLNDTAAAAFARSCLSWIQPQTARIEIVFFSLGAAVLVLRAKLKDDYADGSQRVWRSTFKDHSRNLVDECVAEYRRRMSQAESDVKSSAACASCEPDVVISPLFALDRPRSGILRDSDPFPIIYAQRGDFTRDPESQHVYVLSTKEASIHFDWIEAHVYGANSWSKEERECIDNNFVIGNACWFTLMVMDDLVTRYTLDAFLDLAKEKKIADSPARTQLIRLAYLEATNANVGIRWTTRERDLLLLEKINDAWKVDRWSKNVAERTEQLTTHREQMHEQADKDRNTILTLIAASVGAMAIISILADFANLIKEGDAAKSGWRAWILGNGWWIAPLLALSSAVLVLAVGRPWTRPQRHKQEDADTHDP